MSSHRIPAMALIFGLCFFYFTCAPSEPPGKVEWGPGPTSAALRLQQWQQHQEMTDASVFRDLEWRWIGPVWMSGRITDIAVPKGGDGTEFLAATGSGGVWKTTDEGKSWSPIFERESTATIGDIAIAPSDPAVIWVGTGENNSSRSTYSGTGVFKSTDGGGTWSNMGLHETNRIGRIVIHPADPDIVYVAASGTLYSENPDRGVYRTRDGGVTWDQVLFVDDKTGFIDLAMNPAEPDVLYAAAWQRLRKAWHMWKDGPGSAIYRSLDGGSTWNQVSEGLPTEGEMGRIGLGVTPADPNVVYALVDNQAAAREPEPGELDRYGLPAKKIIKASEVYRSDDRGETWRLTHEDSFFRVFTSIGYYLGEIRVDPNDVDTMFLLGKALHKSVDGGKTEEMIRQPGLHGDHQAMWIDPADSNHVINGNDGGLNISYDGGKSWTDIPQLPAVQFYNVWMDNAEPFNVYGSAQDHGCFRGPVTHDPTSDPADQWEQIPGGEASYIELDPADSNVLYSEGYYGRISRVNLETRKSQRIQPQAAEGEPRLRCTWLTPFFISKHEPRALYFGSQYLHKSLDRGETWQRISPDLTLFDPEEQGDVPFSTAASLSESPLKAGLIYYGSDDGNIQVTRDDGATWSRISGELPEKWVSRVAASGFEEGRVYASLNGYRDDDYAVYLYRSEDYGTTWADISGNLPLGPVNVITEDLKNPDVLYVGTDLAAYVSKDGGRTWAVLGGNLPTTYVHDIQIHPRDDVIVAATHGRGMWVMPAGPVRSRR